MKNPDMAKVMYELNGKPMIEYVVRTATTLKPERILLVVGWQKQSAIDYITKIFPDTIFIEQNQQLGTGHAVLQTKSKLEDFNGDVLILSGDVPALKEQTASALVGYHRTSDAPATTLTAELDDPFGYGRIIRNDDGSVKRIVEEKDATEAERAIKEINSGIYVFDRMKLFESLEHITPSNAQGEYYLTDVFEMFWKNQWKVSAVKAIDSFEVMGINTAEQLEFVKTKVLAEQSQQV